MLVAIDPGKSTGWAAFDAVKALYACGHTDGDRPVFPWQRGVVETLVIEIPHTGPSKATVEDLLVLAFRAGLVAGIIGATQTRTVRPQEWKGSVPKRIHHERVKALLWAPELALLAGHPHDTIDAIGLGLWALGRMGRGA